MIKKIINPEEFKEAIDSVYATFKHLEENEGHVFFKHTPEYVKSNWGNRCLLNTIHVWSNIDNFKHDSIIGFHSVYDPRFNETFLCEFIWLSSNPKISFKLLKEAENWAIKNNYKYMIMGVVEKMPKKDTLVKAYNRMGFVKDSEQYIKELKASKP